jgi:hypothetical protein
LRDFPFFSRNFWAAQVFDSFEAFVRHRRMV